MIDALIKRVSVTYKCYEMYAHQSVLRYTCTYKRKEMFEDTKGQIRSSKSKPGQTIQRPDEKG
jgi:hypothetical protein